MDLATKEVESYPKGGDAGSKGSSYETELAKLFFLRSLTAGHNFKLAVNFDKPKGQKFDDVCYVNTTENYYRMVQSKHNDKREPIRLEDLTKDKGDFSLAKYFSSYKKIQNEPPFEPPLVLKDVVLFTNRSFHEDLLSQNYFTPKKGSDDVFDYHLSDRQPRRQAQLYQLTDNADRVRHLIMERYIKDMEEAADKLLQWLQLKTNDIRLDIFPWNEILGKLKSDVLIIESNFVKFRKSFDTANATSKRFREILIEKCKKNNIDI